MDRLILEALFTTAWCLHEPVLSNLTAVLLRHASGVRLDDDEVEAIVASRPRAGLDRRQGSALSDGKLHSYMVDGSVAVVPVGGVIRKRASMVNGSSQDRGTSVEAVRSLVREARQDRDIGAVLLRVDSPGGSADGLKMLADELHGMRSDGGPPVWAHIDGLGASAAYYIAAQAGRVLVNPDGEAGSIGTYMLAFDSSKKMEKEGYRVYLIRSSTSDVKGEGALGVPISDKRIDLWQEIVDKIEDQFEGAVARARGLSGERLKAVVGGRTFFGSDNVAVGIADGVATVEETIAEMNRLYPVERSGSVRTRRAAVTDRAPAATAGAALAPHEGAGSVSMTIKELVTTAGSTNPVAGTDLNPTSVAKPGDGKGAEKAAAAGGLDPPKPPAQPVAETKAPELKIAGVDAEGVARIASEAVDKYHQRNLEIEAALKPYAGLAGVTELRTAAITDRSMSIDQVRSKLLGLVTAAQAPVGTVDVSIGSSGWERECAGIELSIARRMRPDLFMRLGDGTPATAAAAKAFGYDDPAIMARAMREAEANGLRGRKLFDIAERCAAVGDVGGRFAKGRQSGHVGAMDYETAILGSAFGLGSSDFPLLFANAGNKTLMSYFGEITPKYPLFCAIGSAPDFKDRDLLTMSMLPDLLEVPEGAPLKEAKFDERKETARLKEYGRSFSITRQAVINDDLGAIGRILQTWGIVAARTPDNLVFTLLGSGAGPTMSDGKALYHADHNNLAGSGVALGEGSLKTAIVAMRKQKSFGSEQAPLEVEPRVLLVPVELEAEAWALTSWPTTPTTTSANAGAPNWIARLNLTPVASPRLSTHSTTAWHVLADPRMHPVVEVAFLNGRREPIVTPVGNGSIRGQAFEIVFDCGVKALQFEGAYKNPGA